MAILYLTYSAFPIKNFGLYHVSISFLSEYHALKDSHSRFFPRTWFRIEYHAWKRYLTFEYPNLD